MNLGCPVKLRLTKHNKCCPIYYSASQFITNIALPDISELVVHISHVIFDVDGDTGRLQHLHGELLREGTNKQSSDSVNAGDLIRHADLFGLVPVLQVQHTCRHENREAG